MRAPAHPTSTDPSSPAIAIALLCAALAAAPARAATVAVSDAAGLIAAIDAANAAPDADVIELTADVTFAAVHAATDGPSATPAIVTPIVLRGHGFTIARAPGSPAFRLFVVRGAFLGAGALTLDGVQLAGGDVSTVASNCFSDLLGCGGALLNRFGEVTVRNGTAFTGNAAVSGGAIFNAGGNVTLRDVTFAGNAATTRGGAIHSAGGLSGDPATVVLERARFESNESTLDGGAIHNEAELEIADSVFTLNRVSSTPTFGGGGGAIYNTTISGTARVVGSRFTENEAMRGGALSNYNASDMALENCDVERNRNTNVFGNGGGGIWSDNNADLVVRNSRIVENATGTSGKGGGILAGASGLNSALVLEHTVVGHNVAGDDGGGLHIDSNNTTVASSIVASQIDFNTAGGDGGGVYKTGRSPLTIAASSISDNRANGSNGGGLAVEGGAVVPPVGVIISDTTIARNQLTTGDGGGVSNENQGVLTIRRSTIADNQVTGVGGVVGLGGGVFSNQTNSAVTIENTTISGNRAESNGGGTYNNNASQMTIRHSTITGNGAGLQGGGIHALAGTSVAGSLIVGNAANHPVNPPQNNCGGVAGSFTDLGGNFTNDPSGVCPAGFTVSASITLGALADNGGPTATHALAPGSTGINAVAACGLGVDQRGVPRAALCDAGAWDGDVVVPQVRFATAASAVDESSPGLHDVLVLLDNRNGTIGSATAEVHVAIVGTAEDGSDYDVAVAPPLVFSGATWPVPGDATALAVSIDPTPDFRVEGPETIRLELRDAGIVGPADLGARAVHTVTLHDACPPSPDPVCTTGFGKGTLQIDERSAGKEKLVAQLSRGPVLGQHDFGNPLLAGGTAYRLCVYDDQSQPAATLLVERADDLCGTRPCWKPTGGSPPSGKGFVYKDKLLAADGTKALVLKGGKAGKSQVKLTAGNQASTLPAGMAAALAASAGGATVQVLTSDADCFSRTFTDVTVRTPDRFQAR